MPGNYSYERQIANSWRKTFHYWRLRASLCAYACIGEVRVNIYREITGWRASTERILSRWSCRRSMTSGLVNKRKRRSRHVARAWKLRRPKRDDRICGASFFIVLIFSRTGYFPAIPNTYTHTFTYIWIYMYLGRYILFPRVNKVKTPLGKATPVVLWRGTKFISYLRDRRERRTEEWCLLSCPHFLASSCPSLSSRHFQGSQYLPPVAPLPSALSFPCVPLLALSIFLSFSSLPLLSPPFFFLFLIFHPVTPQLSSYPRLVTTSSGTPFLCRTRSSTGIAARLKGQFRNFHSMVSWSRLFSSRDRGRATDGTILIAFQLRTVLIDDRNYPEEIPSAYRTR